MKKLTKSIAFVISAMLASSLICNLPKDAHAAENIVISPYNTYEINNGLFEGWGTSLCWWANRIGYSDSLSQQAADLFYGDNGLRLNIARFNIGGGDDPNHRHITRTDSNMPGYTTYNNGKVTYDWKADYNQRNVLLKSIEAAGDDMIVEMFSNSPPYYMTESGCSSGGKDASKNNLKNDYYDDFAEYFAEVCYHYEKDWGVDIQSVTPMNEPYTNYWSAYSKKQEGCHFDQGTSQSKIILELQKSMNKRGLSDIIICGTDETSIDTQISSYNKLSTEAKKSISRIDTHSYSGSKRSQLKDLAVSAGKNLWMSEVDGGSTAGTNAGQMGSALWLANRITLDVNELNSSAWIMWQVIDNHISKNGYNGNKDTGMPNINGGFWGIAVADHDKNEIILTKKYYGFGQYTRYIRPGMSMLKSTNSAVVAYDKEKEQLVIVAHNTNDGKKDIRFDLSGFGTIGSTAQVIRTSTTESWANAGTIKTSGSNLNVSLPKHSISTFIIDGVSDGKVLENKIKITKEMISGSAPWNNSANDCYNVFDGNNTTYFDGVGNGWIQVDLGNVYDISAIGYVPRSGYEQRCPDAKFMTSRDGKTWSTIHTIVTKPIGWQYITSFSGDTTARYIKYQVPDGKPNNQWNKEDIYCCNIAEIELYGTINPIVNLKEIEPVEISGSNAWKDSENNYTKVFDGDTSTYFDGVGNGWVQADLGGIYDITTISYTPRKGYEYRCPDSFFQISLDGKNWTTIHTITSKPSFTTQYIKKFNGDTKARYIRYTVPEGIPQNSWNNDDVYCCNLAEMSIYGEFVSKPPVVDNYENTVPSVTNELKIYAGDANCDGKISIADATAILQSLGNGDKYGLTPQGMVNADVDGEKGVSTSDAIEIKKYDAKLISKFLIEV